jgi:hypothetical protein
MTYRTPIKRVSDKKRLRKKSRNPFPRLKHKLDAFVSAMVMDRDRDRSCISCAGKATQASHFIRRETLITRWDPFNVNGQCSHCNCWLHGNLLEYADALDRRYWPTLSKELREIAKRPWKAQRCQLEDLIALAEQGEVAYVAGYNAIVHGVGLRLEVSQL